MAGEWTRSSSNTPSPPTSFGSVGSNDNSSSTDPSSTDPSTDNQQTMSTHFPKPFWKKRFCEDSGENSSTSQQAHDDSHFSTSSKVKSQSDLETSTNSSGIGMEETHHLGKRRKIEIGGHPQYQRKKESTSLKKNNNKEAVTHFRGYQTLLKRPILSQLIVDMTLERYQTNKLPLNKNVLIVLRCLLVLILKFIKI